MWIQKGSHAFRRRIVVSADCIIRLGGSKSTGEWNRELSYFRLTDAPAIAEATTADGQILYGDKPTSLHVLMPSDDLETCFTDGYELWKGSAKANVKGQLLCRGNGLEAERMVDPDDPWNRDVVGCPGPELCPFAAEHTSPKIAAEGKSACGAVGRLRIIAYRVNPMSVYEIRTGSVMAFHGLRNMLLDIVEHPMVTSLSSIPLTVKRVPRQNRFGKTNYPVTIGIPSWNEWKREMSFMGKVMEALRGPMAAQLPQPTAQPPAIGMAGSVPDDLIPRTQLQAPVEEPKVEPHPDPIKLPPMPQKTAQEHGAGVADEINRQREERVAEMEQEPSGKVDIFGNPV